MSKLIYLGLSLFFISCNTASISSSFAKNVSNLYEVIYKDNYKGLNKKTYRVIRHQEDYRAFLLSMHLDKIPKVDFEVSNILILNMGQKSTGGFDIIPEKMIEDGNKLVIILKEVYPKRGDVVSKSISSPVCIVKIDSKKEIVIK